MAVMTLSGWVDRLKYIAQQRKTYYDNTFPGNCGQIHNNGVLSFDCIGLVKSLINDPDIYNRASPVGYYCPPGKNIPDANEIGILDLCTNVAWYKFTDLHIGDYLYKAGHAGVYVGEFADGSGTVNVIECTEMPNWGLNGVITSYIDKASGRRYNHKGGIEGGPWQAHGTLSKYIDINAQPTSNTTNPTGKVDKYINALATLGDGRYHYWDGQPMGIGCSEYARLGLVNAGVISSNESFHAGSGYVGVLGDTTRFQRIAWSPNNLKKGDLMWSNGHHVATWDGSNGVYEAAPESTHGICDNGRTGVGHWTNHTYRNCATGTNTWTCLYRIIDTKTINKDAQEMFSMKPTDNVKMLIEFLPVIEYGSNNTTVKALQTILHKYGWYSDSIDGNAGPNTVKGIKLLQTAMNITVDGICGPQTWTKLLIG